MLRTYAVINQLATPHELQKLAEEALTQSQRCSKKEGGEASAATCYPTRNRDLPRAKSGAARSVVVPASPEPRLVSTTQSLNHVSQAAAPGGLKTNETITRDSPAPGNQNTVRLRDIENFGGNKASDQGPRTRNLGPSVRFSTKPEVAGRKKDEKESIFSSRSSPVAGANHSVAHGESQRGQKPKGIVKPVVTEPQMAPMDANANTGHTRAPLSIPNPTSPLQSHAPWNHSPPDSALSPQTENNQGIDNSKQVGKAHKHFPGDNAAQILPYVVYEGGAYQLPISLTPEMKVNLQGGAHSNQPGRDLTQKLAFLSAGQLQTLQQLLRHDSDNNTRKLAHLETLKNKSSKRFWHRSSRVMVAFIEGDTASMPPSILSERQDLASIGGEERTKGSGMPKIMNEATNFKKDGWSIREAMARTDPASSVRHETTPIPRQTQQRGQRDWLSGGGPLGLPGLQDITPHLIFENEWSERQTEYRMWTLRPYPTADGDQTSDYWDSCLLLEEYCEVSEMQRRLKKLDKKSATVLDKMSTLTASQQIQVMQSIESARAVDHGSVNHRLLLRQLEIVRAKKFFKLQQVKAIVVYVCSKPQPENYYASRISQRQWPDTKSGLLAHLPRRGSYDRLPPKEKKKTAPSSIHSTDSSNTTSSIASRKDVLDLDKMQKVRRVNSTIASRPPRPRRSRFPSPSLTSYSQPTIFVRNKLDQHPVSSDESDWSDQTSEDTRFSRVESRRRRSMSIPATGREVVPAKQHRQAAVYERERRIGPLRQSKRRGPKSDTEYQQTIYTPWESTDDKEAALVKHSNSGIWGENISSQPMVQRCYDSFPPSVPFDPVDVERNFSNRYQPTDECKARDEAVEQLLLEWTPCRKTKEDEVNTAASPSQSRAVTPIDATGAAEPRTSRSRSRTRSTHSWHSNAQLPLQTATVNGPRESNATDDKEVQATADVQPRPAANVRPRVEDVTRSSTVPAPACQAWAEVDWARQIVEETAVVDEPEEYDTPLRSTTGRSRGREPSFYYGEHSRVNGRPKSSRPGTKSRQEGQNVTRAHRDERVVVPEQSRGRPTRRRTVEFDPREIKRSTRSE
ncbi:hypothetical protein GGS20DRAFT_63034 [Poronia punctata]|nr:hypothetical protein GGS20DRAFT_63034 [Poronia punctata]